MRAQFFQPAVNPINLLLDIIRLVRDAVAIANDFLGLQMLRDFVDFINDAIGDTQNHGPLP